jgi:hypothetical protein
VVPRVTLTAYPLGQTRAVRRTDKSPSYREASDRRFCHAFTLMRFSVFTTQGTVSQGDLG